MRNTHLKTLGSILDENLFLSYFTMMGGFKYYSSDNYVDEFNDVIKSEFDFLNKYFNNVVLTLPVQYIDKLNLCDDTINYLKERNCVIKNSKDDMNNLKWKYGISNVIGYGTRWEIANNSELVNWGNTINVFRNNNPFGVDFGGGVESFIYAYKNLKSSIYANDLLTDKCCDFCTNDKINEKIFDCIVSSLCIISNKNPVILRDRYILDVYMRLINSLSVINDISQEKIIEIANEISKTYVFSNKSPDIMLKFCTVFNNSQNNYQILINGKNIDELLKLIDLCYNDDEKEWMNNKKIIKSHYRKYFTRLFEADFLAIKKSKNKILKKRGE